MRTQVGEAAIFAIAAVGILVLMLATNLSGMLLARFAHREREFARRQALGASRAGLFRLAVVESAVLVGGGALLGAFLTILGIRLVARALPPVRLLDNSAVPMALRLEPDWRVVAFGVALCFTAMLLISLAPALRAARADVDQMLRATRTTAKTGGRSMLLAVQVSLCTILLLGAGLLAVTLDRLRAQDPGFASDHIVSFTVDPLLSPGLDPKSFAQIAEQWRAQAQSLPGVRSTAISAIRLLRGSGQKTTVAPAGEMASRSDFLNTSTHAVSRDYFHTLGLKLVEGRLFSENEYNTETSPKPGRIVVNQAFARRFANGQPILGRKFGFGVGQIAKAEVEVIGVVADAKYRSMQEPIHPTTYGPLNLFSPRAVTLLVRTEGAPAGIIEPVRNTLRSLAPDLPVSEISTLEQDIEASLWSERAIAWLSGAFAGLAALIVAAGLYGLLAYLVALRTREIGIRIAVGASPRDVILLVTQEALRPVLVGLIAGLVAGLVLTRLTEALFFGVSSRDPLILCSVALGVLVVGLAASCIPAARAVRVQPSEALRQE